MRRPASSWLLPALLAVTALVLVAVVAYRGTYGNWPWQGLPAHLNWCGRTYNIDEAPLDRRRKTSDGPVYPALRAPPLVGRQAFSDFTADEIEQKQDAGEVCGLLLFVRSDGDTYVTYSLSGGP